MLTTCLLLLSLTGADPGATVTPPEGPTRALGLFKPGELVSLEDGFRDPPPICRAQCWWQCHGSAFTKETVTYQLEQFKAQGMGGVTIKDTLPMPRDERTAHIRDLDYMSPEWLDMLAHIEAECRRLGLILRVRLGSGWNEGGPWITPDVASRSLAFAQSKPIAGPAHFDGPIPTSEDGHPTTAQLASTDAFVVAVESRKGHPGIDLTKQVRPDGKLAWDVPAGTWTLVSCFSQLSSIKTVSSSPSGTGLHHDHLNSAAADVHLSHVPGRLLARLGPFENTAFDGVNHDSWELGQPTWTPGFRQAFVACRGYDPVPWFPVLMNMVETRAGMTDPRFTVEPTDMERRFLFDLRTTASELIIDNFYRHVTQWCHRQGVVFEAEAGGPARVPRDMLQAHGSVDVPMGEFWFGDKRRAFVKIAASASHAYGKRLVSLESLTDTALSKTRNHVSPRPSEMKAFIDQAFLLGGNYLTMASVEYSPREAGLPGWVHNCGPHLNPNIPWWPLARGFYDYMGRCCFLLQSGRDVAQVAVYNTFRTSCDSLWRERADELEKWPREFAFDYVNDELVQQQMTVRDGRIALRSGASYEILCIDPTPRPTMPTATLARIRDLIRQGATVVWTTEPPAAAPGLTDYPRCDAEFKAILQELRDAGQLHVLPSADYANLIPLVAKCPHPAAWQVEADSPLRFVHRRTANSDFFFVVNGSDTPVDTPVTFRIEGRTPEFWIPETGAIEPAVPTKVANGSRVSLRLPAQGSIFVVFRPGSVAPSQPKTPPEPLPSIAVKGPWEVSFPKGWAAPAKTNFAALESWTASDNPGIRYFSGMATYRTTFVCSAPVAGSGRSATLDLGKVAEVCDVRLNGKPVGTAFHPPFRFDVSKELVEGANCLEIRVANLWHNRLVGDADLPKDQRVSHMIPEDLYQKFHDKPLMPSGLMGPVQIDF
jgi:hypothetical protein